MYVSGKTKNLAQFHLSCPGMEWDGKEEWTTGAWSTEFCPGALARSPGPGGLAERWWKLRFGGNETRLSHRIVCCTERGVRAVAGLPDLVQMNSFSREREL